MSQRSCDEEFRAICEEILTVPPEGADLVLSSDVPHGERDVLVFDSLDVETCIAS